MIASLCGILKFKNSTGAVIECNGVGYFLSISVQTFDNLPDLGNQVYLMTLMQIREDAVNLFGFYSEGERDAFLLLNSVSGIGGKTALGILSSISVGELSRFISSQNYTALQKLPGIGKKTAERLCFELKDKIVSLQSSEDQKMNIVNPNASVTEAISALISLGYTKNIAEKAVFSAQKTLGEQPKVESLIKVALKYTMN